MSRFIALVVSIISFFHGKKKHTKISSDMPNDNYPLF